MTQKLKDHQKWCSHLVAFLITGQPDTGPEGIATAESSQTAHAAKSPAATELIPSPAVESYSSDFRFPVMSSPNMLQIIII